MKTKLLIISIFISMAASAQPTPSGYSYLNSGYEWLRGMFRSLHLPTGCGFPSLKTGQSTRSGAIYLDSCANKVYYYRTGVWSPLVDSTYIQDSLFTKQIFGAIYNAGDWTNLNDFVNVSTASVSGDDIVFSGGGGGPNNFNQYLSLNYTTGLERWTQFYSVIVTESSDTSYGLSIGVRSVNSSGGAYLVNNQIKLDLTNGSNSGRLSFWNGATKVDSSSSLLSFSVGDTIYVTVDRDQNEFTTTAYNKTTNSDVTRLVTGVIGTVGTHNTGRFTVWANGGDFTIDSISVWSKQSKNPELLILTDSRALTFGLTDFAHIFPSRLHNYYGSVVTQGGNGDKTNESVFNIDEIKRIDPRNVLVITGVNDAIAGVLLSTTLANIDTIHKRLDRVGIDVYHLAFYSSLVNQIALSDSLRGRYPLNWIDGITDIRNCNACLSDGTHFTEYGHEKANEIIIKSQLIPADQNLLTKININTYGIPKVAKQGGNSFGLPFKIGSLDDQQFHLMRNGRTTVMADRFNSQEWLVMPSTGNGGSNEAIPPTIPGVAQQASVYNGGTIWNLNVSGADGTVAAGVRLATHFDIKGTDDVFFYLVPGPTWPRPNSWGIVCFTELAGGRLMTTNNTHIAFDIGTSSTSMKSRVSGDAWRYWVPLLLRDTTAPSTPESGALALYVNNDSVWAKNDAGISVNLMRDGSGSAVTWNAITNPTGTQTLSFDDAELTAWTNGSNTETFLTVDNNSLTTGIGQRWNSSSITTGNLASFVSTSTAANGFSLLSAASSGANANSTRTAIGITSSVTNSGTASTNIAGRFVASGGTNNYALSTTGTIIGNDFDIATAGIATPAMAIRSTTNDVTGGLILANLSNYASMLKLAGGQIQATDDLQITAIGGDVMVNSTRTLLGSTNTPREAVDVDGQLSVRTVNAAAVASVDSVLTMENGRLKSLVGYFAEGTYTPTLTSVTNVSATTAHTLYYFKTGNSVHVWGKIEVDAITDGWTSTEVGISLPVASNFTTDGQAAGSAGDNVGSVTGQNPGYSVSSDATNDRISLKFSAPIDTPAITIYVDITYKIL